MAPSPSGTPKQPGQAVQRTATFGSSSQDPCTYTTRSEAQAILHAQIVREITAPQGPTCVFELQGQKPSVTLAVESINVARYIAHMRNKPAQLSIAGRTAYCGKLGASLLFVELGGGRVLEVAAPCAAAEALAAYAVPRIKA